MNRWIETALNRKVVRRAVLIAIVIGTLLNVINHGDTITCGDVSYVCLVKMLATYVVPYCVSTVSSVGAILSAADELASTSTGTTFTQGTS